LEHAQEKIRDASQSHRGAIPVHPTRTSCRSARSVERPDAPGHFSCPARKSPRGMRLNSQREPIASLPTTPVSSTTSRTLGVASSRLSSLVPSTSSLLAANQQTDHASTTLDGKEEPSNVERSPMSKACDTLGTEQQAETAVLGALNMPVPLPRATMALLSDPNEERSKTTNDTSPSKAVACGDATNIKSAAVGKALDSSTILSRQEVHAKQSSRSGSSQKKSALNVSSQATLPKSSAFYPPSR
jgi:hypothetical protein